MMMLEIALLLLAALTRLSSALHIPPRSLNTVPELCRTNVSIPSYPEACYSLCQPLHGMQIHCDDSIPCMCHNAPPTSINKCLQCVMDGAGDVLRLIPGYLKDASLTISAYENACKSVHLLEDEERHIQPNVNFSLIDISCRASPNIRVHATDPPTHSLLQLHERLPLLSIGAAVFFFFGYAFYH